MVKCVCFNCKSGYESNREQDKLNEIQFFKAPNDPNIIKEWQIAILRDDIKLKPFYVLDFYLQMRMRKFAKIKMANDKKVNLVKKKAANLVST